jgi:hypothetical protein
MHNELRQNQQKYLRNQMKDTEASISELLVPATKP